jgi:magnesium chelatase family protein
MGRKTGRDSVTSLGATRLLSMGNAVFGACLHDGRAHVFRVECLVSRGLPRVQLVGLPDLAAREARERLPAAFAQQGLQFPKGKVLFNLVPALLPKRGFPVDLALACSLLLATGQIPALDQSLLAVAELDLAGCLRPAPRGVLLAAMASHASSARMLVAPESLAEAMLAQPQAIAPVSLKDLVHCLRTGSAPGPIEPALTTTSDCRPPRKSVNCASCATGRLDEVRGQEHARTASILAVAGRHSILLQGPPGTGKSMLARRIAQLLPAPPQDRALELASLESLHGPVHSLPQRAPFRAPHHSVSAQALLGGGRPLRPGELSRAHGGVLFLDELPEFQRPALEGLRQPLEEREVRIERSNESACFPADVLLIAARNPCPCGFASHPTRNCVCTPAAHSRYAHRTSGPLLDRFDLFAEMGPVAAERLQGPATPPSDEDARAAIARALGLQKQRERLLGWGAASTASRLQLDEAGVSQHARQTLIAAADRMQWSGRAVLRCLRVARTVADTQGEDTIERSHLLQAVGFRPPASLAIQDFSEPVPGATS